MLIDNLISVMNPLSNAYGRVITAYAKRVKDYVNVKVMVRYACGYCF